MPRITIPASEVRKGDVIAAVQQVVVETDLSEFRVAITCTFGGYTNTLRVPLNTPITVDRPDPDVDLVEAMAEAIYEHDGDQWSAARAALAAYRAYTA